MGFGDLVEQVVGEPLDKGDDGAARAVFDLMVKAPEMYREPPARGGKRSIYVSDLAGGCPRKAWMERVGLVKPEPRKTFDVEAEWRMQRGTAYHEMIQSLWIGPTGAILGGWLCTKCGDKSGFSDSSPTAPPTVRSAVPRPDACPGCGATYGEFAYTEISVVSRFGGPTVRGRLDMLLELEGRRVIGDLKITDKSVKSMKAPWQDHVDAMNLYLGFAELETGVVVYTDPGAKRKAEKDLPNRIKVFQVNFDQRRFDDLMEIARAIEETPREEPGGVPCPHGGVRPWGPCDCLEATSAGFRSRA